MYEPKLRFQLIQALTMRVTDTNCWPILRQLDDYVDAQLAHQPYAQRLPAVALHLDACVACAEAYDALYVSAVAEAKGTLPQVIAKPDLSFLQPRSISVLMEQIRAAVQRVGDRLSLQLTPTLAPALRPALATATLRGSDESQRYQEKLIELSPAQGWMLEWPVTIIAYRDSQQPTNCLLEVTVQPPGWEWPDLEGIQVTVLVDQELRKGMTDAWGMTAFEGIPTTWLADLKLEVTL